MQILRLKFTALADEYAAMVFDLILTICDNAQGTPEEIQAAFDSIRDQIRDYCRELIYKPSW